MGDNKNFFLAIALSVIVLFGWQYLIGGPELEKQRAQQERSQLAKTNNTPAQPGTNGSQVPQPSIAKTPGNLPLPGGSAVTPAISREAALGQSPRIVVDTPSLTGSIALKGGRLDDLLLRKYRETVDRDSDNISLFSPAGIKGAYYAEFGWSSDPKAKIKLPTPTTMWSAKPGAKLTPETPVQLEYDNGEGLIFRRTISVDEDYMFSISQEVENRSSKAVTLYPYGLLSRHGKPDIQGFYILFEGLIGMLGEQGLYEVDYDDVVEDGTTTVETTGGWIGIIDKYWGAVLIPDQKKKVTARFSSSARGDINTFQTDYLGQGVTAAPGNVAGVQNRLFAGAKVVSIIDGYGEKLGITNFDLLIDWGWFYFITKPMFMLIDFFFTLLGNFGVAILASTVVIKLIFFPLAHKSYVSMSKMKKLQPEIAKMKERFGDDRAKQQQAMMELYKKEKVNPMSGCLPILLQIPVFFALYKVLFGTIEMRHAPFFGWIQDLAAPDPTTIFNLFGLIPWMPPSIIPLIGVWPIIMGITMFVQMRLNPAPPDPIQAQIFNWMPLFFMFLLASFPAGLVIYWAWNNTLSVAQQWYIMNKQGVKVELLGNIRAMFKGSKSDQKS
jgi:YidC/Oxa1 family membrane protein insertase